MSFSSIDSGFTQLEAVASDGTNNFGISLSYQIQTTATARNPTTTISAASAEVTAVIATFQAGTFPPAGSIALTGKAPALNLGVGTPSGSIALTGYAPLLNYALYPAVGSITFTGYAPIITNSLTKSPGSGAIVFTGQAPAIQLQVGVPAGVLTFTGFAPEINERDQIPAGAITFAGYAPTVQNGLYLTVTAVWPRSDRVTGGATIVVAGAFFQNGNVVAVDGVNCTTTYVSSTRLTAVVPAHVAAVVNVTVTNGAYTPVLVNGFTYWALAASNTSCQLLIGGVLYGYRVDTMKISENPTSKTATFVINSAVPNFSPVRIGVGSLADGDLLFNGEVESTVLGVDPDSFSNVWTVNCVGPINRFKRKLAYKLYTAEAADVAFLDLVAAYASTYFSTVNVQPGLPAITIGLTGDDLDQAATKFVNAIGGYRYIDDSPDVHFYLTESLPQPDALDASNVSMLSAPVIQLTKDTSQLRTRVFTTGAGTSASATVASGETIVPIDNAALFNSVGGLFVSGSQHPAYAGVNLAGGGSLVGPGVQPSSPPSLALVAGTGIEDGVHGYAYTDVTTGTNESLPSAVAMITTGKVTAPNAALTAGTPTAGSGPDAGVQDYEVTFVNGAGETTPSPISGQVTTYDASAPGDGTLSAGGAFVNSSWNVGDHVTWRFTATNAAGETVLGGSGVTDTIYNPGPGVSAHDLDTPASLPAGTTGLNLYGSRDGGSTWHHLSNTTAGQIISPLGSYNKTAFDLQSGAPGSNTALVQSVPLSAIPIGGPTTTQRNIYRRFNGSGSFYLALTVNDNTTTTATDTTANSGLGAAAPSSNTAAANQVSITGVAIGPTMTTKRNIYRTAANASQLQFLSQQPNNTYTGPVADSAADATLGANAPTNDTSGLTQTPGQVLAGATTMLLAGAGSFSPGGGWAITSAVQCRYTGITGNTLTGIPASGIGSIAVAINYGTSILAAPALLGVTGVVYQITKGNDVNLFSQRDNLTAQALIAAIDGSDGIYEFSAGDSTLTSSQACDANGDAELDFYSDEIVSVVFPTKDKKTYVGRLLHMDWPAMGLPVADLVIQDVQTDHVDVSANMPPVRTVTASSVRFTLQDFIRRTQLQ